ncbi:hypothetical protein SD37_31890 [Amycolatopsis orientalis]|uniref:Uncharacterized protein n=1 Tax=Amycolatopsis orientalis TaxID=31958 RepID=A0A193C5L3_AMYOR|nr:hypothetical protein SD37_31890 [Amycolatopsis orientalis]
MDPRRIQSTKCERGRGTSDSPPSSDVAERFASAWKGRPRRSAGGVLLAVGPVIVFFSRWSWWTVAGLVLAVAGALWLAFGEVRDGDGAEVPAVVRGPDDLLGGVVR